MNLIGARLTTVLTAAGIPVVSVRIGQVDDRATWMVQYHSSATPTQRTQGDSLVAAYVEPTTADLLDEEAQLRLNDKAVLAALLALYEAIPSPTLTKPQVKARAIAIYKTL